MDIVHILVTLALIGLFTWAVTTIVPMPDKFKQVINVVAIIAAVVFALKSFGIFPL